MPSLDERCRAMLIPEPIVFIEDAPGRVRFASDHLPPRAVINVRAGIIFGPRMDVDESAGRLTITDSTGRAATYVRSGVTLDGAWICDLVCQ